ncbi:kelch repeat and BTB domain-containing protein 8-like [Branchiostoma lanceolatum]|uniref:kelch repeat and BTB domain-containing protein 8-like n=1 Tax=Branchiostoma lanceolatum TaxID=7740 RepID=UPI00345247A3
MDVTNEVHSNDVLRELNGLRERAELTDVVLEVDGRSFPCHRAVLASCSPYFRGMFTSGYAEAKQERISIQDVSEVAMATILDYAYTGCLQTEPDQVQAVMSAARLLQVDFVGRKAAEYMKDHLDVFNCADVLMYADMLGDCGLVEASERYIASRLNQVVLQPSFLQLSLPLLQSLLNRDDLMTKSEDDVVQAALRWIDSDQEERSQHLPALCKSLRLSLISSKKHVTIKSKCLSVDSNLVYSDSTTQRLGQVRTEMQIFLQADYVDNDSQPCYDPSTGELYAINMPGNLDSFSVTVTPEDELYLAGGVLATARHIVIRRDTDPGMMADIVQKKFYQYNHLFNTWEPRCEMTSPRVRCGLVYLKGYIYAIGGDKDETAERYDPSRDQWTSIPPLPHPMPSDFCAVTLDDSIYVIRKEGCYRFSSTESTWNKMADMLKPPLSPQAVTHQGCIYCIDCDKEWRDSSRTCVEMYNPADGVWKQTGNGKSFIFNNATLMKHKGTLYLFTVHTFGDHGRQNLWEPSKQSSVSVHRYQPETDSWMSLEDKGRLVPPLKWLGSENRTDCLMSRMIPTFLGDWSADEDLPVVEMSADEEEESDNTFSDSSGSGTTDDSEDDLSDQDTSDEDNSDEDSQSGSDDGEI